MVYSIFCDHLNVLSENQLPDWNWCVHATSMHCGSQLKTDCHSMHSSGHNSFAGWRFLENLYAWGKTSLICTVWAKKLKSNLSIYFKGRVRNFVLNIWPVEAFRWPSQEGKRRGAIITDLRSNAKWQKFLRKVAAWVFFLSKILPRKGIGNKIRR